MYSPTDDSEGNQIPPFEESRVDHFLEDNKTGKQAALSPPYKPTRAQPCWLVWSVAGKNILTVYCATHLMLFIITCLSVLFTLKDFSWQSLPLHTLWQSWSRRDTGHFAYIALHGYSDWWRTAFFPLYPLVERGLMVVFTNDPVIAGLIISNASGLVMLAALYRLVEEDFDQERAARTVLYLAIFPTAFFFAAAYSESLFLCLALLSFYQMRRGYWWRAGLFGLFASLTRSVGFLLFLPFCYEYLRQHDFRLKTIRFDALSGTLILAGLGLFALYCYLRFHDPLAFSHAQPAIWNRHQQFPWVGMSASIKSIVGAGKLSFQALRNMLDLGPDLFVLTLILLSFVGPWKLPTSQWAYGIYASIVYLFLQLFPVGGYFPLQSVPRLLLTVFPAFVILAGIGKNRAFNMYYLMISGALLFFLLTQFLTGHWIV